MWFIKSKSQKIKENARKTLEAKVPKARRKYVIDTSAIIHKFLPSLIENGLRGKLIIPNAVMAELEHLANKGINVGFAGLEEIEKFHAFKQIKVVFEGARPSENQIRYARSGEIDSLIREPAVKNKAILITADLVQAKAAQAYKLKVIYLKPQKKKKRFWFLRN